MARTIRMPPSAANTRKVHTALNKWRRTHRRYAPSMKEVASTRRRMFTELKRRGFIPTMLARTARRTHRTRVAPVMQMENNDIMANSEVGANTVAAAPAPAPATLPMPSRPKKLWANMTEAERDAVLQAQVAKRKAREAEKKAEEAKKRRATAKASTTRKRRAKEEAEAKAKAAAAAKAKAEASKAARSARAGKYAALKEAMVEQQKRRAKGDIAAADAMQDEIDVLREEAERNLGEVGLEDLISTWKI